MIRIGLIGEYPTDIECISILLMKRYEDKVIFFPLIYDIHGSNLENQKIKHQLRREFQIERPDYVLFVRDLDGLEDDFSLITQRNSYFSEFSRVINRKGLFLLNIFELEALLFADIEKLEKYYSVTVGKVVDCMKIIQPKEHLKQLFKEYTTGDNKSLFVLLDYEQVVKNCRYFERFVVNFSKIFEQNAA